MEWSLGRRNMNVGLPLHKQTDRQLERLIQRAMSAPITSRKLFRLNLGSRRDLETNISRRRGERELYREGEREGEGERERGRCFSGGRSIIITPVL